MSTDPNDKGAIGARRNEVVRGEPVNETFAQYVQSTAFSLSLGRTHMRALIRLAIRDPLWMSSTGANSPNALSGLERRGLVTHRPHVGEPPPFGDDAQIWELTTAGKLVVMLLAEAGLVQPGIMSEFPPPPPGWTDPRPRMVSNKNTLEWDLLPSERELAGSTATSDRMS
jgi:hypothetical protein